MKVNDKFKGDILKDGTVILADQDIKVEDGGEYEAIGSPGYWFQLYPEQPTNLRRGEECELVTSERRFQIEVSGNDIGHVLNILSFNIRKEWDGKRWKNL